MASCSVRKQDMPPPGGYCPIPYKRVPAKALFGGYTLFTGYIAMTIGALYLYHLTNQRIIRRDIELRANKMAIYPMLLAERDREYLKQLRRNRDAEEELMRDVPGWKVGTWYGEKVYQTLPPDYFVEPIFHEYYVHSDPYDFFLRSQFQLRM